MNPHLDKFIAEHFPGCRPRSPGIRAFDVEGTVYPEDKLKALYKLGVDSRDAEVFKLVLENKLQKDLLQRQQSFQFSIPWWIGLLVGVIAAAHFYFTYLR